MAPFHNKGWTHFEKLLDIMPNACMRGTHAFSLNTSAPPSQLEEEADGDVEEGVTEAGTSSHGGGMMDDAMEIDKEGDGTMLVSASTSKCKLTTFTSEDSIPLSSSFNALMLSLPSLTLSLELSRKKSTNTS